MKLISLLDLILSKIPFNNSKTIIGFIIKYLPLVLPGVPIQELAVVLDQIGTLLMSIGIFHRAIKNVNK